MVSIPLVTWQQHLGNFLFLTITVLFLILILFDDRYLLGTIIYLNGEELQTFLHQDNLQVGCLGRYCSYLICYIELAFYYSY